LNLEDPYADEPKR